MPLQWTIEKYNQLIKKGGSNLETEDKLIPGKWENEDSTSMKCTFWVE